MSEHDSTQANIRDLAESIRALTLEIREERAEFRYALTELSDEMKSFGRDRQRLKNTLAVVEAVLEESTNGKAS